ncbi:MAG: amidohydrolase [Variovorax sp.]|nr:amidohydrolase [Variovorax sp.]
MMIADSQVHLWGDETPDRPWIPGGQARLRHMGHLTTLGPDFLIGKMDEAGIHRAVIVPPTWDRDRIDVALQAWRRFPDRFRIMTRIPVDRPEEAKAMLRSLRSEPAVAGVRLTFSFEVERDWIHDGTADWFWPYAEENDIPVMMLIPHHKDKLASIAEKHPGLRIAVDHMGILGNTTDDKIAPFIDATAALARYPNVAVKISNIPSFSTEKYPFANVMPYVKQLVDAFGAQRCFWGTDLSRQLGKYGVGYREGVALVTDHMPFLSEREKALVLGEALCAWLRWDGR